jgi:hypothetical protein
VTISNNEDRVIITMAILLYLSPQGLYPSESLKDLLFSLSPRTIAQQAKNNNAWTVGSCQHAEQHGIGYTDESDMKPPTSLTFAVHPPSLHPDPHSMISILHQITSPKQWSKEPPHYPINSSQKS